MLTKNQKIIIIVIIIFIIIFYIINNKNENIDEDEDESTSENVVDLSKRLKCSDKYIQGYCYDEKNYDVKDVNLNVQLANNERIATTFSVGKSAKSVTTNIWNLQKIKGKPTQPHSEQIIYNFIYDLRNQKIKLYNTNNLIIYQTRYLDGNIYKNFLCVFLIIVTTDDNNKVRRQIYILKDPNDPIKEYMLRLEIKNDTIKDTSNKTHSETFYKLLNGINYMTINDDKIIFTIKFNNNKTENKSFLLVELYDSNSEYDKPKK